MPMKLFAKLALAATAAIWPSVAYADFIDDFLLSHHYCGGFSGPSPYADASATPLGRDAADWTAADVAHLHEALAECQQVAVRLGQRPDFSNLDHAVPPIVEAARAKRAQAEIDRAAAERAEAARSLKEAADVHSQRGKALADQKKAEEERLHAQALADEIVARDEALIAAAHARRDAALARQKADNVAARLQEAEAEASRAEMSVARLPSAQPRQEATGAGGSHPEPRQVSVTDLQVEGSAMNGQAVSVRGYISVFSDNGATIYQHEDDMNGIELLLENADPGVRRYIIGTCGRTSRTCRMTVKGRVVVNDAGHPEIEVD